MIDSIIIGDLQEEQHFEELESWWSDHQKQNEQPDTLDVNIIETDKTQTFEEPSMNTKNGMLCRPSSNEEESPEQTKDQKELNEVQETQKVHDEENNDFDFHGRTRQTYGWR